MTTEDANRLIEEDPDFVALKRFDYSLEAVVARYPDGCSDRIVSQALMVTEDDVQTMYDDVVAKLRRLMGVTI